MSVGEKLQLSGLPTAPEVPEIVPKTRTEPISAGQVVAGRYEIQSRLGAGGMGSVWRVYDRTLDERAALKVIIAGKHCDPRVLEQFRAEVKLARRITHPHVCRVFDLGEDGDLTFLTMELIEGSTLRDILAKGAPEPKQALEWLEQMSAGVSAAHALGIVHRDLKPENVLIRSDGRALVADFGLAREWDPDGVGKGGGGGTPGYMSPEQVLGKALDARSDVFALGILGYELLTGQPPFGFGSKEELSHAIVEYPMPDLPPLPRLSEQEQAAISALLQRAMAKAPAERFPSAAEMHQAILSLRTPPPRAVQHPQKPKSFWKRYWMLWPILGLLSFAFGLIMPRIPGVRPAPAPQEPSALAPTPEFPAPLTESAVIALSPFANETGDPAWDGLAAGAGEALRAGLRTLRNIRLSDLGGQEEEIHFTLHGSLRRVGQTLRFSVKIEPTKPGLGLSLIEPVEIDVKTAQTDSALLMLRQRTLDETRLALAHSIKYRRAVLGTNQASAREKLLQFYTMTAPAPRSEHLDSGLRLLNEALEIDANYLPALLERANLRSMGAGSASENERIALALADIERARGLYPKDSALAVVRCRLLQLSAEASQRPNDAALLAAQQACEEALGAAPESGHLQISLARLYDRMCKDDEAMRALEHAAELDRSLSGRALKHLVHLALDNERMLVAERISEQLAQFRDEERKLGGRALSRRAGAPEVRGVYAVRGAVLLKLKRYGEAKEAFETELGELAAGKSDAWAEAAAIRGLERAVVAAGGHLVLDLERRLAHIESQCRNQSLTHPSAAKSLAAAYLRVDPEQAVRWLESAAPPKDCDESLRAARIYLAAGQHKAAQQALSNCVPLAQWEKNCVAQLNAKIPPPQ